MAIIIIIIIIFPHLLLVLVVALSPGNDSGDWWQQQQYNILPLSLLATTAVIAATATGALRSRLSPGNKCSDGCSRAIIIL